MALSRRQFVKQELKRMPALQRIFTRRSYRRIPHWLEGHMERVVIVGVARDGCCIVFEAPPVDAPADQYGQFIGNVHPSELKLAK